MEVNLKTIEYKGEAVTIHTYSIGKGFGWWWATDSGLKGAIQESGARTEDLAFQEAEADARNRIDKKLGA